MITRIRFVLGWACFASFLTIAMRPPVFAFDRDPVRVGVAVDLVGEKGFGKNPISTDRLLVRGAELMFFAPADHLFDGQLALAAHQEEGVAHFEIHEAFLGSSKLIPRSRFKIGQFFLGIGRLNQFHQHDWPFIRTPRVHKAFLDSEGVMDTGAEVTTLLPTPFFLEVTAGITNGWTFGHTHNEGQDPKIPTHYARAANFVDLFDSGGLQTGLSYLGRTDKDKTRMSLIGLDVTLKSRESKRLSWLFQSESWFRYQDFNGGSTDKRFGNYSYLQYGLSDQWSLGLGGNYFTTLDLESASGADLHDEYYGFFPVLVFSPSHFVNLKTSYDFEIHRKSSESSKVNHVMAFQAVFILGAHPAHEF